MAGRKRSLKFSTETPTERKISKLDFLSVGIPLYPDGPPSRHPPTGGNPWATVAFWCSRASYLFNDRRWQIRKGTPPRLVGGKDEERGNGGREKESPHRVCFDDKGLLSRAQFEETLLGSLGRNSGGRLYSRSYADYMSRAEIMPVRTIVLFS